MNKKQAIRLAMEDKVLHHNFDGQLYWNNEQQDFHLILEGTDSAVDVVELSSDGWEIYEEPAKEEAPPHVDIEVGMSHLGNLICCHTSLGYVIGTCIERNDTRYFATWYSYNGGSLLSENPSILVEEGKSTFATHVRFVREDLLGGIPK